MKQQFIIAHNSVGCLGCSPTGFTWVPWTWKSELLARDSLVHMRGSCCWLWDGHIQWKFSPYPILSHRQLVSSVSSMFLQRSVIHVSTTTQKYFLSPKSSSSKSELSVAKRSSYKICWKLTCPITLPLVLASSPSSWQPPIYFLSYDWNHTIHGLLCLVSFTQHVFKICPFHSMYQYYIPFMAE